MNTKATVERADIYQAVTDRIIAAIEAGAGSWEMPWHVKASDGVPVNALTQKAYRGSNVVSLWVDAQLDGYEQPLWASYRQWQELGAQVRKGEKSSIVVFWKAVEGKPGEDEGTAGEEGGEGDERTRRLWARAYHVFNCAQVDGYEAPALPQPTKFERIEAAENFFSALGVEVRHGGSRAAYSPSLDIIKMPEFSAFTDPLAFYSTLAHEQTHYAVTRIMPHGRCGRLSFRALAMRRFGIIRALRGRREADRWAGSGPLALAERRREQAPPPLSACLRGCRFGWSGRTHVRARGRSLLDRRRDGAGPSQCCGGAYVA